MCLAVPGKILEITEVDNFTKTARVSFGGAIKTIDLSFVPEAKIGDYIIAHVGFALSVIDEEEAKKTFEYLDEMFNDGSAEESPN